MDSRFKEWVYIEGLMQSAYHEAALKMNLSDSEFWILYVFNFHQEGCNQSVLYKEACLTKSTVNSAIRKMEQKDLLYLTPGEGRNTGYLCHWHISCVQWVLVGSVRLKLDITKSVIPFSWKSIVIFFNAQRKAMILIHL